MASRKLATTTQTILPPEDLDSNPTIIRARTQTEALKRRAAELVVTDETLQEAGDIARAAAGGEKTIELFFARMKADAYQAHQTICEQERAMKSPYREVAVTMKRKLERYEIDRRERERLEEQQRQATAAKRAEQEQIERAVHLEQIGKKTGDATFIKAADAELSRPVVVTQTSIVPPPPPKVAGLSLSGDEVDARIDDLKALALAVGQGRVSTDAISANMSWLKREAKQRGDAFDVPGVTRTVTPRVAVRA